MSEEALYTLLTSTELEVAYDHFDTPNRVPPFILYRSPDAETFKADDKTFFRNNNYIVDLITSKRDITNETLMETIFDNNNIPYDKEIDFIESEQIYQTRYFI